MLIQVLATTREYTPLISPTMQVLFIILGHKDVANFFPNFISRTCTRINMRGLSVSDKLVLRFIFLDNREAMNLLQFDVPNPFVWDVIEPHTPPRIKLGLQSPSKQHLVDSTFTRRQTMREKHALH